MFKGFFERNLKFWVKVRRGRFAKGKGLGERGVGEGEGSLTSAKKVLAFLASFYHIGLNLVYDRGCAVHSPT